MFRTAPRLAGYVRSDSIPDKPLARHANGMVAYDRPIPVANLPSFSWKRLNCAHDLADPFCLGFLDSCSARTVCLTTSVSSNSTMASVSGGRSVGPLVDTYTLE
jgi:hypothetical protein